MKKLPYAENHKANRKVQLERYRKKKKERKERRLIIQERTKKQREGITRGESPGSKPVKQRATERGQ